MSFVIKNDQILKSKKIKLSKEDRKKVFTQTLKQKLILSLARKRNNFNLN